MRLMRAVAVILGLPTVQGQENPGTPRTPETRFAFSADSGGIDEEAWRAAVGQQLKSLEEATTLKPADTPPTIKDALAPRRVTAGAATYEFKEDLKTEEGRLLSSKVEVAGTLRDADVAFFHSGLNRWRVSRVRLETSYHGRVDRKPER